MLVLPIAFSHRDADFPGTWELLGLVLEALILPRCEQQVLSYSTCCGSADGFRGSRGVFWCASFLVPLGEGTGSTGRGCGRRLEDWILKYRRGVAYDYRPVFSLVVGNTVLVVLVMTEGRGQVVTLTVPLVSCPSPCPFHFLGALGLRLGPQLLSGGAGWEWKVESRQNLLAWLVGQAILRSSGVYPDHVLLHRELFSVASLAAPPCQAWGSFTQLGYVLPFVCGDRIRSLMSGLQELHNRERMAFQNSSFLDSFVFL